MRARVWGCRGSLATPGPTTIGYGGNTSCVEVRPSAGGLVVLDAGTGIRALGLTVVAAPIAEIDILLTHIHLDHVEGLAFFAPLFDPRCHIRIWGPRPGEVPLAKHLAAYLSPPFFPVPFHEFPATIEVNEVGEGAWALGELNVVAELVMHRGPTLAYRLEEAGRSLAYIPDNEPAARPGSGSATARHADVLFHDAQYTAAEYATRHGWGHASLADFALLAAGAVPGRSFMFHHDPTHSDDTLEAMLAEATALAPGLDVQLAREGAELEV
jgi:phosphoribosyl 1,2-cyclic phosphodiesterase